MMRSYAKLFSLFFIVPLLLDRFTKWLVVVELLKSHYLVPFFNVFVTYNRGVAWGVGSGMESEHISLMTAAIAIVLMYFIWFSKSVASDRNMLASCFLVLSGGISNFADRFFYEGVVDFLQFHLGDWYFPVFNVADVSITFGAIGLIYFVTRKEIKNEH